MNFIIYENALPVLEEYLAPEALTILLKRHEEFDEDVFECVSIAAEMDVTTDNPQSIYSCYVNAVVQLRELCKQDEVFAS